MHTQQVVTLVALLTVLVVSVSTNWQMRMHQICGHSVTYLFVQDESSQQNAKCRSLRAALRCVRVTSKTDVVLTATWMKMMTTGDVKDMQKRVNDTCQKEALYYCVTYTMQNAMRSCYRAEGLEPRDNLTSEFIAQHCYPLRNALYCMKTRMLKCPDDAYIRPEIAAMDAWITQLHQTCVDMPRLDVPDPMIPDYDYEFLGARSSGQLCHRHVTLTALLTGLGKMFNKLSS